MTSKENAPSHGTDSLSSSPNERLESASIAAELSDDALIARCKSGHMGAFSVLVHRYQHRLFNALLRMVGNHDDAQDLAQEAFVRALRGLKQFRGQAGFYTWLFRIGFNLVSNHRRRNRPISFSEMDNQLAVGEQAERLRTMADPAAISPLQQAQVSEMHHKVLLAMDELDEHLRAVVILRDIEQFEYAQIASILQVPVGTVKSRLSRGRMALRERLLKETNNAPSIARQPQ